MNFDDEFPITMEREAGMPDYVPPVAVSFGMYYQLDDRKTAEAGHDVFRDVEFVKIAVPGDKSSLYFQPATDKHKQRFPKAYEAFKARQGGRGSLEGMPIENWAPISRSIALTLKAAHIHTVEALAIVHDGHIDRIGMNGRELRDKAKAFLDQAKDSAATMKLAGEKKALEDQLAAMQAQIAALVSAQSGQPAPLQHQALTDVPEDAAAAARKPGRLQKATA
jgi:hypothetical protein